MLTAALDGQTCATFTQWLFAFSRQQPLSPEAIDAKKLVGGHEILASTLGEIIRQETVRGSGLWPTEADADPPENVVLDPATNARDATPEGGKSTIETANAHLDATYAAEHEVAPGPYL